jgi:hypothetical protein
VNFAESAGQPHDKIKLRAQQSAIFGFDYDRRDENRMTTVKITLPDELAQEAQRAGLLSPEFIAKWLREQLRAQRVDRLFAAMDRMGAANDPAIMSPEAVAEELAAMRAERRARRHS